MQPKAIMCSLCGNVEAVASIEKDELFVMSVSNPEFRCGACRAWDDPGEAVTNVKKFREALESARDIIELSKEPDMIKCLNCGQLLTIPEKTKENK